MTAMQVLIYNSETLSSTGDIAAGFALHIKPLVTSSQNEDFDSDYMLRQIWGWSRKSVPSQKCH